MAKIPTITAPTMMPSCVPVIDTSSTSILTRFYVMNNLIRNRLPIEPIILAIMSLTSKYRPGKKENWIISISIPKAIQAATVMILWRLSRRPFLCQAQRNNPPKTKYTAQWAILSGSQRFRVVSGRLTPPIVDPQTMNIAQRIAGIKYFKVTYIMLDVTDSHFGGCRYIFFFFFAKKLDFRG